MMTQLLNRAKSNAIDFSKLSTQELVDLITHGQPGSQRSRNAILELIDRDEAIREELEHLWGIVPQQWTVFSAQQLTGNDRANKTDAGNKRRLSAVGNKRNIFDDIMLIFFGINGINAINGILAILAILAISIIFSILGINSILTSGILILFNFLAIFTIFSNSNSNSNVRGAKIKVFIAVLGGMVLGILSFLLTPVFK